MKKSETQKPDQVPPNTNVIRGQQGEIGLAQKPFVVRSRPIGIADRVDLDNIEKALDILEGEERKW